MWIDTVDARVTCPVTVWWLNLLDFSAPGQWCNHRRPLQRADTIHWGHPGCGYWLWWKESWVGRVDEKGGFLIGLRVVHYCGSLPMSWFYFTSPRLPFTRSWINKTKIKKFTRNNGLKQTRKFLWCFIQWQTENILGKNINRELKYVTLLSHGRQQKLSCFPI